MYTHDRMRVKKIKKKASAIIKKTVLISWTNWKGLRDSEDTGPHSEGC